VARACVVFQRFFVAAICVNPPTKALPQGRIDVSAVLQLFQKVCRMRRRGRRRRASRGRERRRRRKLRNAMTCKAQRNYFTISFSIFETEILPACIEAMQLDELQDAQKRISSLTMEVKEAWRAAGAAELEADQRRKEVERLREEIAGLQQEVGEMKGYHQAALAGQEVSELQDAQKRISSLTKEVKEAWRAAEAAELEADQSRKEVERLREEIAGLQQDVADHKYALAGKEMQIAGMYEAKAHLEGMISQGNLKRMTAMLSQGLGSIQTDVSIMMEIILELAEVLRTCLPIILATFSLACCPRPHTSLLGRLQTVATTQTQLHQESRKRMNAEMVRSRVTVPAQVTCTCPRPKSPPPPPSTLSVM
jgi:myosin heavy subunit